MGGAKRNPGSKPLSAKSPEGAQESQRMMSAPDPPSANKKYRRGTLRSRPRNLK